MFIVDMNILKMQVRYVSLLELESWVIIVLYCFSKILLNA